MQSSHPPDIDPLSKTASRPTTVDDHDPYAALRVPSFRRFVLGNVLFVLAYQMQMVAVGWDIYERTHSALALGLVGLVEFLPLLALGLIAGQTADRFDRRHVLLVCVGLVIAASVALALVSALNGPVTAIYGCLFVVGVGRAFQQPAKSALFPQIIPPKDFSNAVHWGAGSFHLASIFGPGTGGLLLAWFHSPLVVYVVDTLLAVVFFGLLLSVRHRGHQPSKQPVTLISLVAGLRYIHSQKVVLGAITLDLFAVLLGGATTLLPVFAKDILHVGADGLGFLRAAPAVGALSMAIWLAHRPPLAHAGRALMIAVAGFGLATIVFGLSRDYWLSLAMLFLTGVFDHVSVVVRQTLIQLLTPDDMRGRVAAVNTMFVGASNELGGFESGLTAYWFGAPLAVALGGIGTVVVLSIAMRLWPQLARYGRLGSHST